MTYVLFLLGALLGLAVWATLGWRLLGGEWLWQSHRSSKCRCGVLYAPTDQCPGARMGRGPRGAR